VFTKKIILETSDDTAYDYCGLSKGDDPVRIAICDDEEHIRKSLRDVINNYNSLPHDTQIKEFSDGEALIIGHKEYPFDIIFLDIQMEGMSGIYTGHEIRSIDKSVIIIFLTSHQQYVYQSFIIEPFDYIVKPVDDDTINNVLSRALKKYNDQHYIVKVKWKDTTHAIDVSKIVYLEGRRRHVVFVTKDSTHECVGKLDEYERQLAPYGFLRCHIGFLVNMNYIKSIGNNSISTIYNHELLMSARKRQDCLKAFNLFLTKYVV